MSVKPRGTGLEVYVKAGGRRYRETVHCSIDQARAHEAQVRADLLAGREPSRFRATPMGTQGTTLGEALEVTYEHYWADAAMARTVQSNIKDCLEHFGAHTPIKDITTHDADLFIAKLRGKGLAASTIRSKCCVMTKMFRHYQSRHGLRDVPLFEMPSVEDNARDRVLDRAEEQELLRLFTQVYDRVLPRSGPEGQDFADLLVILLDTGVRPSEARAIEERAIISGRVTLRADKTKTKRARTIPLTQRAQEALQRQVAKHGDQPLAWATKGSLRHSWDWARAAMGMHEDPGFIPYMLRHTCATRLYAKTKDVMLVMKWLGHTNMKTTLRYAKLQPFDLDNARELLEVA